MHLGLIIKQYRNENKLSMAEFAEKAKISKAYVSVLEKNKDPRNGKPVIPSIPMIQNVANAMGMSFEELFNSLGDNEIVSLIENTNHTLSSDVQAIVDVSVQLETPRQHNVLEYAKTQLQEQNSTIKEDDTLYISDYRRKIAVTEAVAAGRGFAYGNNEVDYCYTDKENLPHFDIASYITGDSMEPEYHDGDVVLIRKEMYSSSDVYVVDYDGKSYLKKVYQEKDRFRLVSFNKKYDDIIIDLPLDDDVYLNIVGRVVGSFPVEK